jgi:hypothetical protein
VSTLTTVNVDAADDLGVTRVELYLDGVLIGTDTSAPYSFSWNPATVGDGSRSLVARAYDIGANTGSSAAVPVTVAIPPTASITTPAAGAQVSGTVNVAAQATDNGTVARVDFTVDGVLRAARTAPPYSFLWNTTAEALGPHTLVATAYDAAGLSTASAPIAVQVVVPAPPGAAAYDAVLKAPRCSGPASGCDSGTLLVGSGTRGPEPNQPNTIAGSCADGSGGTFHADESNDRVKVLTLDATPLAAGKTVRIEATVWAYAGFSSDKLDLYYAANANAPVWVFLATLSPTAAGAQVLTTTYTLPSGSLQAVRARFRYSGSAMACGVGSFNDHDDLVFEVQ